MFRKPSFELFNGNLLFFRKGCVRKERTRLYQKGLRRNNKELGKFFAVDSGKCFYESDVLICDRSKRYLIYGKLLLLDKLEQNIKRTLELFLLHRERHILFTKSNMSFFEAFRINRRRGAHHKVARIPCFWKCHDFPDVRLACKYHNNAVESGRKTAMRRRTVFKCFKHMAEFLLNFSVFETEDLEDALLKVPRMDPDASRRR